MISQIVQCQKQIEFWFNILSRLSAEGFIFYLFMFLFFYITAKVGIIKSNLKETWAGINQKFCLIQVQETLCLLYCIFLWSNLVFCLISLNSLALEVGNTVRFHPNISLRRWLLEEEKAKHHHHLIEAIMLYATVRFGGCNSNFYLIIIVHQETKLNQNRVSPGAGVEWWGERK